MADSTPRIERSPKRIRVELGGQMVADSTAALLVWEHSHFPQYYLPEADVRSELLTSTGESRPSDALGEAQFFTVKAGDREAVRGAWHYPASPIEGLRGHLRFDWHAMDAWFEEDEEVFVHPRDPYTRVDILQSSRHVEVFVEGEKVAESTQPRLLFETGLRTRYYLPKTDLRRDLLVTSDLETRCPYKGTAHYYSVRVSGRVHDDLFWYYDTPTDESSKIAGLVSFYNERVDLYVDGELEEH